MWYKKLKFYNKMDKRLNKRSFKSPSYFQIKGKKKRSLMFSTPSVPLIKMNQEETLKKFPSKNHPIMRSGKNGNESFVNQKQNIEKIPSNAMFTSREDNKHSVFKFTKDENKITKSLMKYTESWRQRNSKYSLERCNQSPRLKLESQIAETKPSEELCNSRSVDVDGYEKHIKKLENSVNRYRKLHQRSLKKLWQVEEKAKEDEQKFHCIKNIYLERINNLTKNLRPHNNALGHLFTYYEMDKNIVPQNIILEMSNEEKSYGNREILEEYYDCWKGSTESSEVSQIQLDSKIALQ